MSNSQEKIRIIEIKRVWKFKVTDAKGNVIREGEKEELVSRKREVSDNE